MTETEWLTCDDPRRMLRFLTGDRGVDMAWREGPLKTVLLPQCRPSERKLRLFVHAIVQQCPRCLEATVGWETTASRLALYVAGADCLTPDFKASLLRDIFGNPFRPVVLTDLKPGDKLTLKTDPYRLLKAGPGEHSSATLEQILGKQMRVKSADSFQRGFWTVPEPSWLSFNDRLIPRLAQAIYYDRAFDRMPILADALEEAGCDNQDILYHCRNICRACTDNSGFCWGKVADCQRCGGTGEENAPHVRGCWVVDLLLGKE